MSSAPININPNQANKPLGAERLSNPASATPTQAVTSAGNLSAAAASTDVDLPLSSNKTNNSLPVLAPPSTVAFDQGTINAMLSLLSNETTLLLTASTSQRIDDQAKLIKEQNELQAANLKKQQQALQDSKNKSWFSKIWGYVSKIATAIAAVAITLGSGGAAGPLAAYMIYTSVAGLVKSVIQDTGLGDAKWLPASLGDAVGIALVAAGVDEKTASYISAGVDIAIALVSIAAVTKLAQKGADAGAKIIGDTATQIGRTTTGTLVSTGASTVSAIGQVGTGWTNKLAADATATVQSLEADNKQVKAMLERAKSILTQEGEFAQAIEKYRQSSVLFVSDLLASEGSANIARAKNMA